MSLASYLRFAFAGSGTFRLLGFGFLMMFASSFGQTFFIGIFGPAVRTEFGLSHTSWGTIYMAGTLLSAAVLPWTGQQIDRMPLRKYTMMVCAALVLASVVAALTPAMLFLVAAIFLLRQTGQGLAAHIGSTGMARIFHADRGKAVALASLGRSVGESALPVLAVLAIAAIGWRATYGVSALLLAGVVAPLAWWLLRGYQEPNRARPGSTAAISDTDERSWTRMQVLRHSSFYLLLPAIVAPSIIVTAIFFHQSEIALAKGWSVHWVTGSYWLYAVGAVAASLAAGPLVDRITAVRVLPTFLVPILTGLLIVWAFDGHYWAWPYLLLVGLTVGVSWTSLTALWAEVYGLAHFGAIRSLAVSINVFSSALGPPAMGLMMDAGITVENTCAMMAVYCLVATILMIFGLRSYQSQATIIGSG